MLLCFAPLTEIRIMRTKFFAPLLAAAIGGICPLNAEPAGKEAENPEVIEVEVLANPDVGQKAIDEAEGVDKKALKKVELEHVTYNLDRSQFVGYYQDGWFEMISLHDAKTKKQIGYVYCDGGFPTAFRFSKDGKTLGAKASVGWYVWKIPSFEKVFVLGDVDFFELEKKIAEDKAN